VNWKKIFKEGKELVLATCSKDGRPNANIAISHGFVDDKLLIADCQMETTIKNLRETKKICVIAKYYRLKGSVEIHSSGKYFDLCVQTTKEYPVKNAVVVNVEEVFDLDKLKRIL